MTPAQPLPLLKRRHPPYGAVLLLVFALLWAQLFGQLHQVRHAAPLHVAHVAHAAHAVVPHPGHASHPAGAGLLAHLLAPDGDEFDCRLYDQYAHADGLPALPLLVLPVLLPAVGCWVSVQHRPAAFFALFEARGPPRVR